MLDLPLPGWDPCGQFEFLHQQLDIGKQPWAALLIMSHIPPGVYVYDVLWKNGNMDGFQALYLQPHFAAQFAAGVPIFITGAVSPVKPEKLIRGTFYLLPEKS